MPSIPYNLQIRNKIVTQLQAITGSGDYFYNLSGLIKTNQPQQLQISTEWHVNVTLAGEEQIGEEYGTPNKSHRTLRVRIEITHQKTDGIDIEADMLNAQQDIERAVYADRTLGGTGGATDCTFDSTEEVKDEIGQVITGKLNIYYNVNYHK